MKVLYAIQGTGNGHLSRARDIIPILKKNNDVDILISGTQAEVALPYDIKYRCNGLGFIFGKNGGVDLIETYKKNHVKLLWEEINQIPVESYQLVINDFEPVSAWACYLKNIPCIGISHQAAVLNKNAPQPKDIDLIGKAILKNYAPTAVKYGFHFKAYDKNIFPPVIRNQIREHLISNNKHYTVYLPAYSNERIIKVLSQFPDIEWHVFSKHIKGALIEGNISIFPINNDDFVKSMASAAGVLCGAGFETPAEALFMKKKLMVIPMKGQFEQQCNAAALKQMGVPVIKTLKLKHIDKIASWIEEDNFIEVDYPNNIEEIINQIIATYQDDYLHHTINEQLKLFTFTKFRTQLLKKIINKI